MKTVKENLVYGFVEGVTTQEKAIFILENYQKTYSAEIDLNFNMFKSDVYELAKQYDKGELHVYDRSEWLEHLTERLADARYYDDLELIDELDKLSKTVEQNKNIKVVLNDVNDNTIYLY